MVCVTSNNRICSGWWLPRLSACVAVLTVLIGVAVTQVAADMAVLPAVKDATLYEPVPAPMLEYAANGSGDYTFTGTTRDDLIRRAVIAFDIAGQIPAGATIDSVELTLNVSRVPNPTNLSVTSLHRLLVDWGEGESDAPGEEGEGQYPPAPEDVTWIHRYYDHTLWASPGGEFMAGASANLVVGDEGVYTWGSTAGMVADVQQWLDQPSTNFGWAIIGDEAENKTSKRFDSREIVGDTRPQLTVNYTPVVVVGSCCTGEICQVVTEDQCLILGGEYGGDGTSCSPNPCVDPFGACCADDGTCTETTLSVCAFGEGEFQGEGSMCQPLLCPVNLTPWLDALPLPAVAAPVSGSLGAAATYDLAIRQTTQQLHSGSTPCGTPSKRDSTFRREISKCHWQSRTDVSSPAANSTTQRNGRNTSSATRRWSTARSGHTWRSPRASTDSGSSTVPARVFIPCRFRRRQARSISP